MAYFGGGDGNTSADWLLRDLMFDIAPLLERMARLETRVAELEAAAKARDDANDTAYAGIGGWE